MKKMILSVLFISCIIAVGLAQIDSAIKYKKSSAMIPMRDGVKLFTVILSPVNPKGSVPVLLERTPYGADIPVPDDTLLSIPRGFQFYNMAQEGYIFVFQDIRGKYKSEGTMQIHQPLIHETQKAAVDESTDTYDAIDWLIKNVPNNNGKAGITGPSGETHRQ